MQSLASHQPHHHLEEGQAGCTCRGGHLWSRVLDREPPHHHKTKITYPAKDVRKVLNHQNARTSTRRR